MRRAPDPLRSRLAPPRRPGAVLAALALAGCHWLARPAPPPPEPAPAPPPPESALPALPCERALRIEVRKSERAVVAHCQGGGSLSFAVGLSRERGPKRARGDLRTPEGEYRIAGPARASRFHRFLPIDYPSLADAEAALAEGRISAAERDAIATAHREGRLPPQNTALGGHLGFHGEGKRWEGDLELDWTEGCFALSDTAIDSLAALAPPGTPVQILP